MAGLCCDSDLYIFFNMKENKSGIKNNEKPLKSNNIFPPYNKERGEDQE